MLIRPGEDTTHPPSGDDPLIIGAAPDEVPALVLVYSRFEPHRVGEVAVLDDDPRWLLGRSSEDAGARTRVLFARRRPGEAAIPRPLRDPALSRDHLKLDREPLGHEVRKCGAEPLLVNGDVVERALVTWDDLIEVKGLYIFLYTRWPASFPASAYSASWAFGDADPHRIVGEGPGAWALRDRIAVAAASGRHVLLGGPSGTGKELAARGIHDRSARAGGPFIPRNASTFTPGLIDSELFGNPRHYPYAGMPERPGLIGAVRGGTLFLDELGELPEELQAHFLRLLDPNPDYLQLGDPTPRRADLRVIAATNRDLSSLKHDLLARFTVQIHLPSLDARREDIPLLVRHRVLECANSDPRAAERFVQRAVGGTGRDEVRVHPALITALLRRRYTTNVRELDRILWECISATPGTTLMPTKELLAPLPARPSLPPLASTKITRDAELDEIEETLAGVGRDPAWDVVLATLVECRWNQTRAAKVLCISRDQLRRLIAKNSPKTGDAGG